MDLKESPLKPRLILFLSVDVVGSTRYKNEPGEVVQPWLPFFLGFYREFSATLKRGVEEKGLPRLYLWKALGDELVFYVELRSQRDAVGVMEVFVAKLLEYRNHMTKKELSSYLNLKGTAWVAGFPVRNSIIFPDQGGVVDFIGPSIDIGFRISKFSSPDALCVSVELAALLIFNTIEGFALRFESTVHLKGVLNNQFYPLICISPSTSVQDQENPLAADELELRIATPAPKLKAYCRKFIERHSGFLSYPFIDGDPDFGARPANYDTQLKAIERIYESVMSTIDEGQSEQDLTSRPPGEFESQLEEKLDLV